MTRWLLVLVAWLLSPFAAAAPLAATAEPPTLTVYVREGCPHCADAKAFLATLQRERPSLRIVWRDVVQDPQAGAELEAHSRAAGLWPPGVPTFVVGAQLQVGFDDAEHAGRELVALLDGAAAPTHGVETRWFGRLSASRLGLPLFTIMLGLLDGFNPCAMWVLLFLLSLLVRLRDRRRMALVAGTFVLASGAVYYAFMAAWLNVFQAIGLNATVRGLLAAVALLIGALNLKDALAGDRGPSLGIPASARPGLVARMQRAIHAPSLGAMLLGVGTLAVVVNGVELLCTAGLPAIYTAVLSQQDLGAAAHHAYLALYIAAYLADDALMVGVAIAALGSGKMSERTGRALKGLSGAVMLGLGLMLAWKPEWLG